MTCLHLPQGSKGSLRHASALASREREHASLVHCQVKLGSRIQSSVWRDGELAARLSAVFRAMAPCSHLQQHAQPSSIIDNTILLALAAWHIRCPLYNDLTKKASMTGSQEWLR